MGIEFWLQTSDGAHVTRMPDPNGGTFDAAGDIDDVLGTPQLRTLGSLDPHGHTTLRTHQMRELVADIDAALELSRPGSGRRGLRRLRVMAEMCATDGSLVICAQGD